MKIIKTKKYKFCLWKSYFDKGYGLTSIFKWMVAVAGIGDIAISQRTWLALLLFFIYGIGCFIVGRLWYKTKFIEAEIEVSNQYNHFVREVRKRKHI